MSAAARAVLRSNSYHGVDSPVITTCHEQDKSKGSCFNGGLFGDLFVVIIIIHLSVVDYS